MLINGCPWLLPLEALARRTLEMLINESHISSGKRKHWIGALRSALFPIVFFYFLHHSHLLFFIHTKHLEVFFTLPEPLEVFYFLAVLRVAGFDVAPKWVGDEDSKEFFYILVSDGIEILDIYHQNMWKGPRFFGGDDAYPTKWETLSGHKLTKKIHG